MSVAVQLRPQQPRSFHRLRVAQMEELLVRGQAVGGSIPSMQTHFSLGQAIGTPDFRDFVEEAARRAPSKCRARSLVTAPLLQSGEAEFDPLVLHQVSHAEVA